MKDSLPLSATQGQTWMIGTVDLLSVPSASDIVKLRSTSSTFACFNADQWAAAGASNVAYLSTEIIFKHLFAVESHMPQHLIQSALTCYAFARIAQRAFKDTAFMSNGNSAETWVAPGR